MTKVDAPSGQSPRIEAIREAIAVVEAEKCACKHCWLCNDKEFHCEECGGGHLPRVMRQCSRCKHIDELYAQLWDAEECEAEGTR